jgi:hypothetical protein
MKLGIDVAETLVQGWGLAAGREANEPRGIGLDV